jgi:chaperonin GroES
MSKVKIKPLADRILVEPAKADETTKSGIIIPDTVKEKPYKGKVVAVGPGTKDEKMRLKPGDQIIYSKFSGTEVQFGGIDYLIMKESDVYGVLTT